MGCHTYFNNKVSCINDSDIERLRKHYIKDIKKSFIYTCSLQQWLDSFKGDFEDLESSYTEEEKESDLYKTEVNIIKNMASIEYYNNHHNQCVEDLKKLNNASTTRRELLDIFNRHDISFSIEDDDYSLWDYGWGDNFRVSDYVEGSFNNAKEAIKFLEEYDNGENITCGLQKGMCDEIREIITDFFKKYPNGSIHYG